MCVLNETHCISMNCQSCTININVMTQNKNISNLRLLLARNMSIYHDTFYHLLSPFILPAIISSKEIFRL